MIVFCPTPIPVIVLGDKEGYLIYVSDSGSFENDVWTVVLCDGGIVRHFRTDQITVHKNGTFDIVNKKSVTNGNNPKKDQHQRSTKHDRPNSRHKKQQR